MSWLSQFLPGGWLRRALPREGLAPSEGHAPVSQDTMAAIQELSRAVRNNPDAVEIYLALGNLFRSQGEIERAVHIRESLIVRPGLDARFKARAWYELGRDFRRAGMFDRAHNALAKARELWGDNVETLAELAGLAAERGDFEAAARHYERLSQPKAQAHYLVRLAQAGYGAGNAVLGRKWLDRALAVHPGSVEAWSLRISRAMGQGQVDHVAQELRQGLDKVDPALRFVLMEGLLADAGARECGSGNGGESPEGRAPLDQIRAAVLPALEERMPDQLLAYYAAMLLLACNETAMARVWLQEALAINADLWPARLKLLRLDLDLQQLEPGFRRQLDFFMNQGEEVERFVCLQCGIKRKQVFHVCPRCHSWHSIAFRMRLRD